MPHIAPTPTARRHRVARATLGAALTVLLATTAVLPTTTAAIADATETKAVLNLTVTPGNGAASLSWEIAPDDAAVGRDVEVFPTDEPSVIFYSMIGDVTNTTTTIWGLDNGTEYSFRVRSHGSPAAVFSGSVRAVPSDAAPLPAPEPTATPGNESLTLTWTKPVAPGYTILQYDIGVDRGAGFVSEPPAAHDAVSHTVTGLTNGTIATVRIRTHALLDGATIVSTWATVSGTPALQAPSAPVMTATLGNRSALIAWTEPDNGDAAITGYVMAITNLTTGALVATYPLGANSRSATQSGLVPGQRYEFRLTAANSIGSSPAGVLTDIVAEGIPGAPLNPSIINPATDEAAGSGYSVIWSAPSYTGGAAALTYGMQYRQVGTATWSTETDESANFVTLPTMTAGATAYEFRVRTRNSHSASDWTTMTRSFPLAPSDLTVTRGDGSAKVDWTDAPANGSSTTGFAVHYRADGAAVWAAAPSVAASPLTITGLTNGTAYSVRVRAEASNVAGPWLYSTTTVTPGVPPTAPGALTATPRSGAADLEWDASSPGTGTSVMYGIEQRVAGTLGWTRAATTNGTTISVNGLTNGVRYEFRVTATSESGSAFSVVSMIPADAPTVARDVVIDAGHGALGISWTAPSSDGGAAITEYAVIYQPAGGSATTVSVGTDLSTALSGLTAAASYDVSVVARNAAGLSTTTAPVTVTTLAALDAPGSVTAVAGDATAKITWAAPAVATQVTGYRVTYQPSGAAALTVTATGTEATLTGLQNGLTYAVTVTALAQHGVTATGTATAVTPMGVPRTPSNPYLIHAGSSPILTFGSVAPTNDTPINGYEIQLRQVGAAWDTPIFIAANLVSFTSLTAGTEYEFRIRAVNDVHSSEWATISGVPQGRPATPRALSVAPLDGALLASWTAPANIGGTPITSYLVQWRAAGDAWTDVNAGTETSVTLTGLANGTSYEVRVTAANIKGNGPAAAVSSMTPAVPQIALSASAAQVGGWIDVTIDGVSPTETYALVLHSDPLLLGSIGPGASGTANLRVQIPTSTPLGMHTVTLHRTNAAGASLASLPLTVSAAPLASVGDGGLATTGLGAHVWAAVPAALALFAGALLLVRRRRFTASH